MISVQILALILGCAIHDDAPPFPVAEPAAVGIDPAALERLKVRAGKADSDSVVVLKDGKLVADWTFSRSPARSRLGGVRYRLLLAVRLLPQRLAAGSSSV